MPSSPKGPRVVLAIDPGVTGAAALIRKEPGAERCEVIRIWDLPTVTEQTNSGKNRRSLDPVKLADLVKSAQFDFMAVERLVAPPGIHSITAFSLGKTAGTIQTVAALAGHSLKIVSPNVWKNGLAVPKDKSAARRFASQYFGHDKHWPRVMDHNRAEAALIGVWALMAG